MQIVITDIRYKMALAPLWSLTQAGHEVLCGEYEDIPDRQCLGFYSRYCGHPLRWPRGDRPAQAIAAACPPGSVVLPTGRDTLRAFAADPTAAERVRVLVPPLAVLDRADDKAAVEALARSLGIPTPQTYRLEPGETPEALARRVRYPVILKLRNGEALGLKSWQRYRIARQAAEFPALYRQMDGLQPEPVVQDYLAGPDIGVAMVLDAQSRPVDFFCYESLGEYPLSGGPTCLCRSIEDRHLVQYAAKLLGALGMQGLAMLDFKGDGRCLLEVNPRLWGSAALATAAEATLYESWAKATLGTHTPLDVDTCRPSYRVGVTMKFLPHCLMAAGKQLRAGKPGAFFRGLGASLSPGVAEGTCLRGDRRPRRQYWKNLLGGV